MKRGPGTNEEQMKTLRERMTNSEVKDADSIRDGYHPDVISLAHKMSRQAAKKKLPMSVSKLIAKLPSDQADEVRTRLLEVNE